MFLTLVIFSNGVCFIRSPIAFLNYNSTLLYTIFYTNFEIGIGIYLDESNNNQNPLFIDYDNNNFSLYANSPCIDNGINYYEFSNTLILDLILKLVVYF